MQVGGARTGADEVDRHRFSQLHWTTGSAGRQAVERADRLGVGDLDPHQLAAVALRGAASMPLALQRDRVGHDPAAGPQRIPAAVEQSPAVVRPPPMKIASGPGRSSSASGALPITTSSCGTPSVRGVAARSLGAVRVALDRDRPRGRLGAQPLDRDRAAAGADVPQQRARRAAPAPRASPPGRGAWSAAPSLLVGVVGQARRRAGSSAAPGPRHAFDRDRVQRVGWRARPTRAAVALDDASHPAPPSCSSTTNRLAP